MVNNILTDNCWLCPRWNTRISPQEIPSAPHLQLSHILLRVSYHGDATAIEISYKELHGLENKMKNVIFWDYYWMVIGWVRTPSQSKSLTFSTRNVKKKQQRANQTQPPNHPTTHPFGISANLCRARIGCFPLHRFCWMKWPTEMMLLGAGLATSLILMWGMKKPSYFVLVV